MVAKINLLLLLALVSFSSFCQDRPNRIRQEKFSITGKLFNLETREPLPGASIFISDLKQGFIADSLGRFVIRELTAGHHVLEFTHTGFGSRVEHIDLRNDLNLEIGLSSVILENEEVIVTGVSGLTSARRSPVPVKTIRKSELLQTASTNIIDAIARVPGVAQLTTGPAISKPFIRGLGYNRVVVVNEGVRQEGQQWGDEHGIEIDEMSVGRIEIVKGPASLMYGSDAIAGVVSFQSHTPVADGQVRGNIYSQFQTNARLYALHGTVSGNRNGFNWNLYGTYKSAGDYRNKYDGRVLNSRFNEKNFGGYIGLNKSWGYSHLIASTFNQESGMVEGDREAGTGNFLLFTGTSLERVATEEDLSSRDMFVPYLHTRHNRLVWDNSFATGRSRVKLNLAYQQNHRKEFGDPENPGEPELFFDLETVTYRLHWQLPEIKEWHTTLGVNGMWQRNQNMAEEVLIPEYDLFDAGFFVFAQRFFSRTTLSGGLRYDTRSLDTDEFSDGGDIRFKHLDRVFSNFSGSVGISHEISNAFSLKANIARGFRAPTVAELSSNGTHEGTNRYEYGDETLDSETSFQADLGFEFSSEHFHTGVSFFHNSVSDFIFYRRLASALGGDSLVDVDGEFIPAFQFGQQDARLAGFELMFDVHPHPLDWLHFENRLSFVRGRFGQAIDGSRNLPLIPAARLLSELRGDFAKPCESIRDLYARVEFDYTFRQENAFTGFGTETATDGYALWNLGWGGHVKKKTSKRNLFSLHFSVSNLFDKNYQSHLSRLKYTAVNDATGRMGVFNMGRNFSVKLNVPFGN
jgi:iron complex outermembrane receptor protein